MSITSKSELRPPHVALFPTAGMGHLIPFLRLATMLDSRGCTVTFITVHPIVSAAESDHLTNFFTIHKNIKRLEFQLLPYEKSNFTNEDPFFIQIETIANSVHLLHPLLSSLSTNLSAIIADFAITTSITKLASDLSIPTYIVITTSARFFSVMVNLGNGIVGNNYIEIPGLGQMPISNIPPPMLNSNHYFAANISSNVSSLCKVKGVLINTFTTFEPEAIEAVNIATHVARLLPLGPFESFENGQTTNLPWLDQQEPESVVFISFGSRTALSIDQIRELGSGLEKSRCKFLWVLKTSKVDKDDYEEVEDILGKSFLGRIANKGIVIKGWVNQDHILAHPAIGGFVSHCGWNSVMEAARLGVPILAWPQHGDQRVNAEVVEMAGLGLWVKEWGWGGQKLVNENEISEKINELMLGKNLRSRVNAVKENARQTREINGSSELLIQNLIEALKIKEEEN